MVAQTTHAAMLAQQQVAALVTASMAPPPPPVPLSSQSFASVAPLSSYATPAPVASSGRRSSRQQQQSDALLHQRLYFSSLALEQHCARVKKAHAHDAKSIEDTNSEDCDISAAQIKTQRSSQRRAVPFAAVATTTAAADADWKRWRRVQPAAIRQRKASWVATSALPLSPTAKLLASSPRASHQRSRDRDRHR